MERERAMEEYLEAIEDIKYDIEETVYDYADRMDDMARDALDRQRDKLKHPDSSWNQAPKSLLKPLILIDKALKSTCEEERNAKNMLERYRAKGDKERERAMEEYLEAIEDIKYDIEETVYDYADSADDMLDKTRGALDRRWDKLKHPDSFWNQTLKSAVSILIDDQTRIIEAAKAHLACRGEIDKNKNSTSYTD